MTLPCHGSNTSSILVWVAYKYYTIMTVPEYGTFDYYKNYFADILIDCATGDKQRDAKTLENLLRAFDASIVECLKYHEDAVDVYRQARHNFLDTRVEFDLDNG